MVALVFRSELAYLGWNLCLNIGVLPIQISETFLAEIFDAIASDPKTNLEVNLPLQTLKLFKINKKETFQINAYKKDNLSNGYDDIDYLKITDKTLYEMLQEHGKNNINEFITCIRKIGIDSKEYIPFHMKMKAVCM